jgi:hypothetical protein
MAGVSLSEIATWLPVLFLAMLVILFVWRKLYRRFPLFFSYIVASELINWSRFVAFRLSYAVFFYVYWISDVTLTILAFLALYELFIGNLFARFHKVRFYRFLFPSAGVVILGFTLLAALRAPKISALLVAAQTFYLLRAVILMFFVLLVLLMGREWKKYEFAITLGFGIYASALVAYAALSMRAHYRNVPAAEALLIIAYDLACFIWLASFWGPEKGAPNAVGMTNSELLSEAKKWEGALKEWLTPKSR